MLRDKIVLLTQWLPQNSLSRAWGWLARRQRPRWFVHWSKRWFVNAVGVDMSEAEGSLESFASLEQLFVRRLRQGSRPIDSVASSVVSPVDGTLGACGTVTAGDCWQVKGRAYRLAELLGSEQIAATYEGGQYMTIYLAPKDYHRIHSPVSGLIEHATLIPGGLMPVFAEATHRVDRLFARNERIVTYIETAQAGQLAVVKVGATLVGRITLAYDDAIWSNGVHQSLRHMHYDPPHRINKGDELGAFMLGSTVVLIAQPKGIHFSNFLANGQKTSKVRMGQAIGVHP